MTLRERIAQWLLGADYRLAAHGGVNMGTDDYWPSFGRRQDRDQADIQRQYDDALTAWRKNPLAWRIVQITTDYTVGEGIKLSSPDHDMQRFIESFWRHPENNIALRLESMSEELCRSGDLFPLLFRERHTGVSVLRFMTKDEIAQIETKGNDWEREIAIYQKQNDPTKPKKWVTPHHPGAGRYKAIALHYHINRPIGAQFGESRI